MSGNGPRSAILRIIASIIDRGPGSAGR